MSLLLGAIVFAFLYQPAVYAKAAHVDVEIIHEANRDPKAWVASLLGRRHRPTLEEVVTVLENCEDCVAEIEKSRGWSADVVHNIEHVAAEIIVQLENLFPYGVYCSLGRDAFAIADLLEAFYVSLGIHGRVCRLGASTATFQDLSDIGTAVRFLKSNGFDPKKAMSGERPFVVLDRTGYSPNSQSTRLMRAIISTAKDQAEMSALGQYTSIISSQVGDPINVDAAETAQIRESRANLRTWYHGNSVPPLLQISAMSSLTDTDMVWHNGFGYTLEEIPGTKILAGIPSDSLNVENRRTNLRYFWELYKRMGSAEMQERIWKLAAERGMPELRERLMAEAQGKIIYKARPNRLHVLITRDLERQFSSELREEDQEVLNMLARERRARWTKLAREEGSELISMIAHQFKIWRERMLKYRKESGIETSYGRLLLELAFDLPVVSSYGATLEEIHTREDGQLSYLSPNGARLIEVARQIHPKDEMLTAEEVADFLRVAGHVIRSQQVSTKDDRRLVLFALAHLDQLSSEGLRTVAAAIDANPIVRRLLIDKAKVYLTSKRYNGERAREVYTALVEAGSLPMPDNCTELLQGADGE